MAIEKKVVDASVVVKWFLNEESSDKALSLLSLHGAGEIVLLIPDFCFLEVLNVLRYKRKDAKFLIEINKTLGDYQLHVEKVDISLLEKACILALKYNLTVYDAIYLALAHLYGTHLITADKDLAKQPNGFLIEKLSLY